MSSTEEIICWCCWSSEDSFENPLIRACYGCKDIELQYIHKTCLETYLNNLPIYEFAEFKCTRCCDNYPVEVTWSSYKTMRNTPLIIIPIAVIASLLVTMICLIFALNTTTKVTSPLTDFLGISTSLRMWAFIVFLIQTFLTVVFLILLRKSLPKSPYIKVANYS